MCMLACLYVRHVQQIDVVLLVCASLRWSCNRYLHHCCQFSALCQCHAGTYSLVFSFCVGVFDDCQHTFRTAFHSDFVEYRVYYIGLKIMLSVYVQHDVHCHS